MTWLIGITCFAVGLAASTAVYLFLLAYAVRRVAVATEEAAISERAWRCETTCLLRRRAEAAEQLTEAVVNHLTRLAKYDMDDSTPHLLTPPEAADVLRLTPSQVSRLARLGTILVVRLPGDELRFDAADLARFVVEHKQPATADGGCFITRPVARLHAHQSPRSRPAGRDGPDVDQGPNSGVSPVTPR